MDEGNFEPWSFVEGIVLAACQPYTILSIDEDKTFKLKEIKRNLIIY
jgi:hypothetical protein